jgi:hypothetical protein
MKTVFICHSSTDNRIARRLVGDLTAHGLQPWIDEVDIKVGHSLLDRIETGLSSSDFVAILLSREALRRPWVRAELKAALTLELAKKTKIQILPLLLEDCPVPLFLRDKKYADFRRRYQTGLEELLATVAPREHPLQRRLNAIEGKAVVDILRKDGSVARITKETLVRCEEGRVTFFIDTLFATGDIRSVRISPGRVVDRWREGGKTFFRSEIDKPLVAGRTIRRSFSSLVRDTFGQPDDMFDVFVNHPTRRIEVAISFPKSRPPSAASFFERRGVESYPEAPPRMVIGNGGRPEVRVIHKNPRLYSTYVLAWTW